MPNNDYIELDRKFVTVPKDRDLSDEAFDYKNYFGDLGAIGWDKLIEKSRVIILAEAGAGKTCEIKATTERLRNSGKSAFFLRLEMIEDGLDLAFDLGTKAEFLEWTEGTEQGWFFLDSVDEARLVSTRQFELAISKFAVALGITSSRAHIYITSRVTEWRPTTDLEFIKAKLPIFVSQEEIQNDNSNPKPNVRAKVVSSVSRDGSSKAPTVVDPDVVAIAPLSLEQVRKFASVKSVQDVASFILEIQKTDSLIFASRPLDLEELIQFWNNNKRIGRRRELLEANITQKLEERDPARAGQNPLSAEEALLGAKQLASASTLMKVSRLQVPDAAGQAEGISCGQVLHSWNSQQIKALLSRPVFDEAIYGTVRFHHRIVREYLTAQWLLNLLADGKSRRAIEGLFIQQQYGQTVLIPSMRPILAWMILFDNSLRGQTIAIAPEVALQGGDPTEWPLEVRASLLKKFCSHYSGESANHLSFDLADLRRFAHADLGPTLQELLQTYQDHSEIRFLLLRMIWQAEIADCNSLCFKFALNKSLDPHSRLLAIRALAATAAPSQVNEIVAHFVADVSERDDRVISELFEALKPGQLKITDAIVLLERGTETERTSHRHIGYSLNQYIDRCKPDALLQLIVGLKQLIDMPQHIEQKQFEVSQQHSWLLSHAAKACKLLIENRNDFALLPAVVATISTSQVASSYLDYDTREVELGNSVRAWPELNDALFWHDVGHHRSRLEETKEKLTEWWQARTLNHYWQFSIEDFSRILRCIETQVDEDDKCVALSLAYVLYNENGRSAEFLKDMKKAVQKSTRLKELLAAKMKPAKQSNSAKEWKKTESKFKRQRREREQREATNHAKAKATIAKGLQHVNSTKYAESGAITEHQAYLFNWLRRHDSSHTRWALHSYELLTSEFGQDVAAAFRDGAIKYWKAYQPRLRSTGVENPNSVPWGVIFGLTGIEIELRHDPSWVEKMTPELASRACQFALLEMNGLPEWIRDIHSKFPQEVREVILGELHWEIAVYAEDQEVNYALSDVTWHGDWLKPELAEHVYQFLAECTPKHLATLKQSLAIVLSGKAVNADQVTKLVRIHLDREILPFRRAVWFAAWVASNGILAVEALGVELAGLEPQNATDLAVAFLNALLGDRHETLSSSRNEYSAPKCLHQLYELILRYIRPNEDIERAGTGVFSPGPRDNAQEARNKLFKFLLDIPGKETYIALKSLAKSFPDRPWYENQANERAEQDAEQPAWTAVDLLTFGNEAERKPQNHRQLYSLAVGRLLDLRSSIEDADDSLAEILLKSDKETELRNFTGKSLRDKASGRYSIPQEEELADAKRPDLRMHGSGIDAPVPIEIKIADNWSGTELGERLKNQLCGDYLRDMRSRCGIYLLYYRGTKASWRFEVDSISQTFNFEELIEFLQQQVNSYICNLPEIDTVSVIGINLQKRTKQN